MAVESLPGLERTGLDSGIRVLSEKLPGVRSVSLGIWIDTGSRDEADNEAGLTHFLEHLLFKGTERLDARGIAETFDGIGADINAFTGREHTALSTRVLDRHLDEAVGVMMEMLSGSVMEPGEIDSERKVVLEEIAMHADSPDELVHDHLAAAMWGGHPVGHAILGRADVINSVDRESLMEFYRARFVGSRVVVAAAGAIDHGRLSEIIAAQGAGMACGEPADRSSPPPGPLAGRNTFYKETEQAHICLGAGGLCRNHPDRFALAVMDNMLGGSMSSRLFQSVREQRGLAYSIYSYSGLLIDTGMVGIYCGTQPGQAQEVIALIEAELEKVRKEGFTKEEIARAKNHITGSLYISLEDSGNRMGRIAKAEISKGEQLTVDELVSRVEGVTGEDITRVFERTWSTPGLSLAVVGPFRDGSISLTGTFQPGGLL